MKRHSLANALVMAALLNGAGQNLKAVAPAAPPTPTRQPTIRRYKPAVRVERSKKHDQKAKLERRAERQANDVQRQVYQRRWD